MSWHHHVHASLAGSEPDLTCDTWKKANTPCHYALIKNTFFASCCSRRRDPDNAASAHETVQVKMALPVDPKAYYGYLFKSNKQPTEVLDQLLRGIALYIVSCGRCAARRLILRRLKLKLTAYRLRTSATSTTSHSARESWPPFIKLSAVIMTVCFPSPSLLSVSSCYWSTR